MPLIPNIKAAQAVVISRQRLQKGLSRDASNGPKKALSLRDAEQRYPGSKRPSIARIIKQLEAANTLDYELVIQPNMGRPRLLSDDKDKAIAKEAARYKYEEAGIEEIKQWFKRLDKVIMRYGIGASEIWNADQAGNAAGETTPPWLIFKAFLTLEWANIEGDLEMRFA
ncbi:hypothetical protein FOXYS1_8110 [Fusarium oxysporum]|uniref:Uncharacterized protein n=1 Tax=Fusarium oxysporum TaxID=5507 RepID=A0A8H5AB92_FUSOX|nr:hypothetical protein FOXYS1_8110 [Fusarium oxysporum]